MIVVPVGRPRIRFNGHRLYSYDLLTSLFNQCEVVEFSLITDPGKEPDLIVNADPELAAKQNYGCGCFWFRKK